MPLGEDKWKLIPEPLLYPAQVPFPLLTAGSIHVLYQAELYAQHL